MDQALGSPAHQALIAHVVAHYADDDRIRRALTDLRGRRDGLRLDPADPAGAPAAGGRWHTGHARA